MFTSDMVTTILERAAAAHDEPLTDSESKIAEIVGSNKEFHRFVGQMLSVILMMSENGDKEKIAAKIMELRRQSHQDFTVAVLTPFVMAVSLGYELREVEFLEQMHEGRVI